MDNTNSNPADITAVEARICDAAIRLIDLEGEVPTPGWADRVAVTRSELDGLHAELDRAMGVTS